LHAFVPNSISGDIRSLRHGKVIGGDGNGVLIAGPNRSILLGGTASDMLIGCKGDHVFTAGSPPWDN
jgi:hypothetical protein